MPIRVPAAPGPSERSANMRANRRRDTSPEISVRRLLHAAGYRFRVDLPVRAGAGRPVRPDIAFTRRKLAVFIDGCFWHGCPLHGRRAGGVNDGYWTPKIARNRERDTEQDARLHAAGWRVLRFWEHDDPERVASLIGQQLRAGR
jgi:DNA mismatch endonuclease (patch repair protein)